MRYRVLGTTHAFRDDGTSAAVGGARLRALLAALALRPGRTVPVSVLVAEVWDGDPPADGVAALQALIGRLRRALGHTAVASADGGYRLRATEDDVDAHRFTHLAAEGTRALGEGDAVKASALLEEALALWQGPALADLPDRASEAARWETRRREARRTHLAALLALGRADEVLPELTALCEDFPLDERIQALRIRALRDAGRPAEALAAYEEIRRGLAGRLGTDPGPELRALHGELLAGDDTGARPGAARPPGAAASPAPSVTAPSDRSATDPQAEPEPHGHPHPHEHPLPHGSGNGNGSESGSRNGNGTANTPLNAPLNDAHTPAPGTAAAVRSAAPRAPGNLRARLTSFVGRKADIGAIHGDLAQARLVTLLGPGGAGKTRLSQEAAEADGAPSYPDGVWLAELAPVEDPAAVPEAVLTALGGRETVLRGAGAEELRTTAAGADEPLARLVEYCERRRMLLVLDNCEHVIGAAAEVAETLLTRCPELTVLATSREPLGVPGEAVRPVGPLPPDPAHRLFEERGRSARPGFDPAEDPAAVGEICRRLDGLPLAIELAAARLRGLTPRQIADRLDDRFRLLNRGSRTVLPRQQTLRAVVDWSWDLLDEGERTVLRRLSAFTGGCDLAAAEAVCGAPYGDERPPSPNTAATTATTATTDGTVTTTATATDSSAAAATTAAPVGSAASAAMDTADLLGSLVDKSLVVAIPDPDAGMRYRLLETVAEYAVERLDEAGDRAATERRHLVHYRELARTTEPLLRGAGQRAALDTFRREYENLRTALRRAHAARDEDEMLCLVLSLIWFWQMLDRRAEARHWATSAVELGPDPFAEPAEPAPPIHERCTDAPPPMTPEVLQEARREVRLIEMLNADLSPEVWVEERADWLRSVARVYRAGLPQTCRYPGAFWLLTLLFTGDGEGLRVALDETVRMSEALGYDWDLAGVLQMRANMLANRGASAGDAVADADRSLALFEGLGDEWGIAEALSARGEANERLGRFERAAADYKAAVEYAAGLGARNQVALLRVRLAQNLVELGRGEEGEAILDDVLHGHGAEEGGGQHHVLPVARLFLALWLGRTGRRQQAREELRRAGEEFRDEDMRIFRGFVLAGESWLDIEDGSFVTAREHIRQALALTVSPMSQMVAPEMAALQLLTATRALAGLARDAGSGTRTDGPRTGDSGPGAQDGRALARDAARMFGAYEALLPAGHIPSPFEREQYETAGQEVLAALGGDAAALAEARAAGGALTHAETMALI